MRANLTLVSVTCRGCGRYGHPGRQPSLDAAELTLVCDMGWMYTPADGWTCHPCTHGGTR